MSAVHPNTFTAKGQSTLKTVRRDGVLHVCRTGEKEQFYTLYLEVKTLKSDGATSHYCQFVQNLAHKEEDAIAKATTFAQEKLAKWLDGATLEVHPEPRPVYTRFEIFGIEMKMSKKRTTWYGNCNETFWDEWRTRKAEIKQSGYWVKRMEGTWLLFKKVEQDEISWESI